MILSHSDADVAKVQPPQSLVIVTDDQALLAALTFALELEGYAVSGYRSGSELLSTKELPLTGCLVIDSNMRGTGALDLLTALRQRGILLPAIVLTSHPTVALRRRAFAETASIVEKPLLGDELANAVRAHLGPGVPQ